MRVDIDEPGNHGETPGIDHPGGLSVTEPPHRNYLPIPNPNVGVKPRIATTVQHPPPANQYVESLGMGGACNTKQSDDQNFGNVFHWW